MNSNSSSTSKSDTEVKRSLRYKLNCKQSYFKDSMTVEVVAGRGGDGCVSFLREMFRPKGPPAGGNGGRGADIVFVATPQLNTLSSLRSRYKGLSGAAGRSKMQHGRVMDPMTIEVPVGTVLREVFPLKKTIDVDEDPGNLYDRLNLAKPIEEPRVTSQPLGEIHLDTPGAKAIVAKGGRGGFGNVHFSSHRNSPRKCEMGALGESRVLHVELKTIADIGLIGHPNAGKSSLLRCLSRSQTKVADYPFTTLRPHLGTVIWPDAAFATIADIPGLVEDAHKNVGLGHSFLKHIERCKMFMYVVDLSNPDPIKDLCVLLQEIESYKTGLSKRPSLVVGNKADKALPSKQGYKLLKGWLNEKGYHQFWPSSPPPGLHELPTWPLVVMSAKFNSNTTSLLIQVRSLLEQEAALQTSYPKHGIYS